MKKPFVGLEKVKEIADVYPTPFHLYDKKGITDNAVELYDAFKWNEGFKEYFAVKATPNPAIIKLLKDNSFDLKKVLKELKPETVAPIIKQFLNSAPAAKTSASAPEKSYGIAPIARVADKDIVYTLN